VDDHASVPSKTSTYRRNDSQTPYAYARMPGTVPSVTRTSVLGSLTGNWRSRRLLTSEKIAVFAPMPSARESTAIADTIGVALKDRKASFKSSISTSIRSPPDDRQDVRRRDLSLAAPSSFLRPSALRNCWTPTDTEDGFLGKCVLWCPHVAVLSIGSRVSRGHIRIGSPRWPIPGIASPNCGRIARMPRL
jgi:hypothetical protein